MSQSDARFLNVRGVEFRHPILVEPPGLLDVCEPDLMPAFEMCATRRPAPVCACGYYLLEWQMRR